MTSTPVRLLQQMQNESDCDKSLKAMVEICTSTAQANPAPSESQAVRMAMCFTGLAGLVPSLFCDYLQVEAHINMKFD